MAGSGVGFEWLLELFVFICAVSVLLNFWES